jgi:hypothetical protein
VIIPELAGFELALLDLRRRLTTQSQTALSACVKKKHRRPAPRSPGEEGDSDTSRDDEALAGDSKVS